MSNIKDMYTFVENKDKTWTGIGLTEKAGKYQGVVYKYGKVSIDENKNNEDKNIKIGKVKLDKLVIDKRSKLGILNGFFRRV